MKNWMVMLGLSALMLAGCKTAGECGEAECAAVCAQSTAAEAGGDDGAAAEATGSLSTFESSLLQPKLDDIRQGVREFTENAIGICKGERKCDEFLGTDVGELLPGSYVVRAELGVPNIGDPGTWKVKFATDCTITRTLPSGESSSSNSQHEREYDVRYAGKDRGYRLEPLRTLKSPNKNGRQECKYTITAPHGDGDKVFSGSWTIPAEAAE